MANNSQTDNLNQTDSKSDIDIVPPRLYKVVLHNDDYTPMDFVVEVLIEIFRKNEFTANQIMLNVHQQGKGICGVYPYEVAETKVMRVHELAEQFEYPLKASLEEE
ncbi:MAG: ATP-dependent Clp protease adapter ClpS [Deltaproteobacteria bacterium]|nr:ATP-dependent Clp protease adapter ClpS [Deltaproteobacteria bacterium]